MEYKGRLTGEEGNELTKLQIESFFKKIGLETIDEDYRQTYQHEYFDMYESLSVSFNSNDVDLRNGIDFMTINKVSCSYEDLEIVTPSEYEKFKGKSDVCLLFDSSEEYRLFNDKDEHVKVIMYKSDQFFRNILISEMHIPILEITDNIYDRIKENDSKLSFHSNYEKSLLSEDNVVGKINGESNRKCILITAHFDHVGYIDDVVFRGAIDNGSGVYLLLSLANELTSYISKNKILYDIYFVALNGEESGMQGSKSFVDYIKPGYDEIAYINIDSIGKANSRKYIISGDNSFANSFIHYLSESNYEIQKHEINSDNVVFDEAGIVGLTISQEWNGIIHSINDNQELVSLQDIDIISEHILNYLLEYQDTIPSRIEVSENTNSEDLNLGFIDNDDEFRNLTEVEEISDSKHDFGNDEYIFSGGSIVYSKNIQDNVNESISKRDIVAAELNFESSFSNEDKRISVTINFQNPDNSHEDILINNGGTDYQINVMDDYIISTSFIYYYFDEPYYIKINIYNPILYDNDGVMMEARTPIYTLKEIDELLLNKCYSSEFLNTIISRLYSLNDS